jgi:hypothetical protein
VPIEARVSDFLHSAKVFMNANKNKIFLDENKVKLIENAG